MFERTLAGFGIALGILAALGVYLWIQPRIRYPVTHEITPEWIRLMLFGRILFHRIPRDRIAGVRLQDTPSGYWGRLDTRFLDATLTRPFTKEGVVLISTDGGEWLITPDEPRDFIRRLVASGVPYQGPEDDLARTRS